MLFSSLFFILVASSLIGYGCSLKCFSPSELASNPYNTLTKPANRYGATITLERDGWTGHWVTTAAATILLQEFMGYNTTIVDRIGDAGGYERLANEFEGANFEMWPDSQGLPQYKQYITIQGKVVDAGTLGITGRSGWYVPTYVVDQYPQFGPDFWRFYQMGINNALQMFDHAGTTPDELLVGTGRAFVPPQCIAETYPPGCRINEQPYFQRQCNVTKYAPCIELLAVDGYYDPGILQQQVLTNNLSIVIPFLGEINFYDRVRSYLNNKKPVLFYYWAPSDFIAQNNFTRVALRDPSAECYSNNEGTLNGTGSVNCDFRTQPLTKAYSSTLKNDPRNDDFRNFISTFKLSTEIQLEILSQVSADAALREVSAFTETCEWIKDNFNTWSSWIYNHEIRFLQSNEQLAVTWDESIRTLSLALSVLGTWTTLILVEQSIFLKVKGERYVPWLVLSTVGQGMCGIWTMHLAGLTAYKLGPGGGVAYIYPEFIPWEAVVSVIVALIGTVLAFLLMLSHPTFAVEKSDIDISISRPENQHIIQATLFQRFINQCIYLKTKCDWRVFLGGLLLSMSVMGTFALAQNSAQIPATMAWNASFVFGAIVVAYVGSCTTLLLTFHLRGSWRYMTAFIMGVTVFGYHNIISSGITYYYQADYHKLSNTWTSDVVRLLVSISTAVTCLAFIGLNVSRLKLSRNEMEQEIKNNHKLLLKVQSKLNYEKNCRSRDHQQIHELSRQIEFINMCRPINRSYAFALAIKHKANITDPILSESTNVPPAGVVALSSACPSTSAVSREDSLVRQDACPSTSAAPISPAHVAVKIDLPYIKTSSALPPHPRSNSRIIVNNHTNKQSIKGDGNAIELSNGITSSSYQSDIEKHDMEPISRDASPIFRERHLSRVLSRLPQDMGLKSSSVDGPIILTDQDSIYRSPSTSPNDNHRLRSLLPTSQTIHQPATASSMLGQVHEPQPSTSGKAWMKIANPTLLQILNNPVTLELLKDQMVSDHSVETLMLYLDIQKYKVVTDSNLRKQLSSKIFDTFLNDNSQHQVNISSQMRTEIAKNLLKSTVHCFEHVESEMISLMTSNTLGRFRASEHWVMALLVLNTPPYTDRSPSEHSQNQVSTTASQSREEESAAIGQHGIFNIPSWVASSVNSNQHDQQDTDNRTNMAQDQQLSHVSGVRASSPMKSNPLYDDAYDPSAVSVSTVHVRTPPSPSLYLPSPTSPSALISTIAAGGDRIPIPALEGGLGVPASRSLLYSPQPHDS